MAVAPRHDAHPYAHDEIFVGDRDPLSRVVGAVTVTPVPDAAEPFALTVRELPRDLSEAVLLDTGDLYDRERFVVAVEQDLALADVVDVFAVRLVLVLPQTGGCSVDTLEDESIEPLSHLAWTTQTERAHAVNTGPRHAEVLHVAQRRRSPRHSLPA